jgi:hypothetical protein
MVKGFDDPNEHGKEVEVSEDDMPRYDQYGDEI